MYFYACGLFLFAALVLNLRDSRMLSLTLVVGASIFSSPPMDSRTHFYMFCIIVEIAVAIFAIVSKSKAGNIMAHICAVMTVAHIGGLILGGGLPLSPYQVIIKLLEFSQLLACVALSPAIRHTLKADYATTT